MPTIDIALPDELMQALTPPSCDDLQLPSISGNIPSLPLPMGGGAEIQGVADFTGGVPTDCKMQFSLVVQLAPIMASMKCLFDVLGVLSTILGVVKGIDVSNPLAIPGKLATAIPKIAQALEKLVPCIGMALPGVPLFCFVAGVLELIASMLLCTVTAMESIIGVLGGLEVELSAAQAAGNDTLVASLTCAQQNASAAATGTMQALQPITVLLSLAQPFIELAGKPVSITIPSGAIDPSDTAAMKSMLETLGTVAKDIKTVADALQCPS
jgi:hypothetical protein